MLSPVSVPTAPVKPVGAEAASAPSQTQQPPAAATTGEAGPANLRAETLRAVDAVKQSTLPPKLREGETNEGRQKARDLPAGPPPAFKETLLEQQARTALEPPDLLSEIVSGEAAEASEDSAATESSETAGGGTDEAQAPEAARAEAGFAESRRLSEPAAPGTSVDVRS
ncbi:hypothetical protein GQ651_02685 [Alphaproteobacteria bacterium GH1-50]|uniref:Uncharacterized protein n=1 Tax=Kangsaoukella pontilimi TaxID=2691042 RepID=A0A7C9IRA0_9RHOB|nr:hypothetical protein [Kangsaoukella pontilimi]MXQ06745.1 hypothetical protein [Kangsaoukella pontilimi]